MGNSMLASLVQQMLPNCSLTGFNSARQKGLGQERNVPADSSAVFFCVSLFDVSQNTTQLFVIIGGLQTPVSQVNRYSYMISNRL
jgi:hypothetical protein